MSNAIAEKDCLDRLKELGFETVVGEFGLDSWGATSMLYFTPALADEDENDWIEDSLETYIYDLLDAEGQCDSWDYIEGKVTIDVAKRSFAFDLEGKVSEQVEVSFTVEEETPEVAKTEGT